MIACMQLPPADVIFFPYLQREMIAGSKNVQLCLLNIRRACFYCFF